MEIIFTRENETADERIEKLAKTLKNIKTKIYVATSDYIEQWTIFSQGALRKSARELYNEVVSIEESIRKKFSKFRASAPLRRFAFLMKLPKGSKNGEEEIYRNFDIS